MVFFFKFVDELCGTTIIGGYVVWPNNFSWWNEQKNYTKNRKKGKKNIINKVCQ